MIIVRPLSPVIAKRSIPIITVCRSINYVPASDPFKKAELHQLKQFVESSSRTLIMTGAGVSTESGIPDYRSEGVGLYVRNPTAKPIQYQQFVKDADARRRYWARNFVGWPRFSSVIPNATHRALTNLLQHRVGCIVTQNVDSLHQKAGSDGVIELHGTAFRVVCLSCGHTTCRHQLQRDMQAENPHLVDGNVDVRPDGDVDLDSASDLPASDISLILPSSHSCTRQQAGKSDRDVLGKCRQELVEKFKAPHCKSCGGVLKPDIVFFGDNVPRRRVDQVTSELNTSDALLVLGSSLQVFSGYRFVVAAKEREVPIAIVNIGPTRADQLADIKISRRCGPFLDRLVTILDGKLR